jgi:hypothetical protein
VTTPYANTATATAQIALTAGTPALVGAGSAGARLASALIWRGLSLDTSAQVFLGPTSGVTAANGWPMQAGIMEERARGPAIAIYAVSNVNTVLFVEEES